MMLMEQKLLDLDPPDRAGVFFCLRNAIKNFHTLYNVSNFYTNDDKNTSHNTNIAVT